MFPHGYIGDYVTIFNQRNFPSIRIYDGWGRAVAKGGQ